MNNNQIEYKLTIDDKEYYIVDDTIIKTIEEKKSEIYGIINNNENVTDKEVDELYKVLQDKWKDLYKYINEIRYNIYFKREDAVYILDVIYNNIEYNINNIFLYDEIKNTLKSFGNSVNKDVVCLETNVKETMCFYNLIKENKLKKYSNDVDLFINIIKTFNTVVKIMEYFDTLLKNCVNDIHNWLTSKTQLVENENNNKVDDSK